MHLNIFALFSVTNFFLKILVNILHAIIALCRGVNLDDFATPARRVSIHFLTEERRRKGKEEGGKLYDFFPLIRLM